MAHLPSFWQFLSIFGFVFFLGIALVAESFVIHMKEKGWSKAKIKFMFFDLLDKTESVFRSIFRKKRIR